MVQYKSWPAKLMAKARPKQKRDDNGRCQIDTVTAETIQMARKMPGVDVWMYKGNKRKSGKGRKDPFSLPQC